MRASADIVAPNFGLPGQLITCLVTTNFWELLTLRSSNFWLAGAVTSYYTVTIKSVNGSLVSATHVVHPTYPVELQQGVTVQHSTYYTLYYREYNDRKIVHV